MNSRTIVRITCAALLTCFVMLHASLATPYEILFHSGSVLPPPGRFDLPVAPAGKNRVHALLQLEDYIQKGQREALHRAGVELLAYLPDRAYVASVRSDTDLSALRALGVRHLSPFLPEYKIHPRVLRQEFGPWSAYFEGQRIFAVEIMPDVSLDEAENALKAAGCEVGHRFEAAHTMLAAFAPERAPDIALLDEVLFLNEAPPPLENLNNIVRQRLHVDEIQAPPYNLSGNGVTILVFDGGMADSTHPDLAGRVRWNETGTVQSHATHVSGTVGGSGQGSGGTYRGMAPQVRIISGKYDACIPYCLYESPNDIEPDYTRARLVHGVELTTNSIGANIDPNRYPCEWFGDYETTSRLLDRLTHDTGGSPLIIFFAAGNERGGSHCANSSYRCMSVPAGAKNIITCGATTSSDGVASFSSWGPTDDGRIKPEVCATGVDVTSCVPGGGYADMSGTSMATPATSGTACLLLEQWHRMFPGAPDPLPETIKAILINSTTDIGPAGPDFQTGFGLVNGLRAVQNMLAGGILESALEIGEEFVREFTVPNGLGTLYVSLAWSDVPAVGNVIPTLVNDLDLWLVGPNGTTYRPHILRPNAPSVPASPGVDTINVCERVQVASPPAGTWTLHVSGRINSGNSQTFGLAANVQLVGSWVAISGQIRNRANQQGIPGQVQVVGGAQVDNTDAQGNYLLILPGAETYTLRALAYGFASADTTFQVDTVAVVMNFALRQAQMGTLNGVVVNQFATPLPGAIVTIRFPNATIPPCTASANGTFTVALPGSNIYRLDADYLGVTGTASVLVPEGGTVTQTITINDPRFGPATDSYGYQAYEETDPGASAVYDWMEISPQAGGRGTPITGSPGNDWVTTITLPFPVRFYGQVHTQAKVSADGWVQLGTAASGDTLYRNINMPNTRLPNGIIAVFWDDMYPYDPTYGGDIASYYDSLRGRFIIEYHNVPHYMPRTNVTTAQLIFYTQAARPTLTGDNEFEIQIQHVDYDDGQQDADGTIGIENFSGTVGIQIVYDGTYHTNCFPITDEYALRFTTGPILGYGRVEGQVTTVPALADYSTITLTLGSRTARPNAAGIFAFDSVYVGRHILIATLAGYETGRDTLDVQDRDTVSTVFELYRLDPPRNLQGYYDEPNQDVHLFWDRPLWAGGGRANEHDRGVRPLDAFVGYRVVQAGTTLATTTDTFYTHHITQSGNYRYWIVALYDGGISDTSNNFRIDLSAQDFATLIPETFYLKQNYPNPFNPVTRIEYGLPQATYVRLEVFDVLGRTVAVLQDGPQVPGHYAAVFNGAGLGSGLYFYRLKAGAFERIDKMLLLR